MDEIFKKISAAKHIELFANSADELFIGSVLYSYALTLHKKVSFVFKEEISKSILSCTPWLEKIKKSDSSSADLKLTLEDYSFIDLYQGLKKSKTKVNKKMATALYGALLSHTKGFSNSYTDGTSFALASELIALGAESEKCRYAIVEQCSLAKLRLKAIMLKKMTLVNSATVALFFIDEEDLKATRASEEDAVDILYEAFSLEYVESSILLRSDLENRVVKIVEKGK
jgi:hypothetical protein